MNIIHIIDTIHETGEHHVSDNGYVECWDTVIWPKTARGFGDIIRKLRREGFEIERQDRMNKVTRLARGSATVVLRGRNARISVYSPSITITVDRLTDAGKAAYTRRAV